MQDNLLSLRGWQSGEISPRWWFSVSTYSLIDKAFQRSKTNSLLTQNSGRGNLPVSSQNSYRRISYSNATCLDITHPPPPRPRPDGQMILPGSLIILSSPITTCSEEGVRGGGWVTRPETDGHTHLTILDTRQGFQILTVKSGDFVTFFPQNIFFHKIMWRYLIFYFW